MSGEVSWMWWLHGEDSNQYIQQNVMWEGQHFWDELAFATSVCEITCVKSGQVIVSRLTIGESSNMTDTLLYMLLIFVVSENTLLKEQARLKRFKKLYLFFTPPWIATFAWWRGLSTQMILGAMWEGLYAPGRVAQTQTGPRWRPRQKAVQTP